MSYLLGMVVGSLCVLIGVHSDSFIEALFLCSPVAIIGATLNMIIDSKFDK